MEFACAHCGKTTNKPTGHVNRSRARGLRLFCGRRCAGLGRRQGKTKAQRKAEKRAYDAKYRRKNLVKLKAQKRAYYQRTYDPEKARIVRKKRAPWHLAYCRRPEYKRWKSDYDRKHLAEKNYGPFAEAAMLTMDLNREIKGRMTNEQIKWENQTCNKAQFRRRAGKAERDRRRPRHRHRRNGHSAAVG